MLNADTELLFPIRVIPILGDLRGEEWKKLIAYLSSEKAQEDELCAFTLMMVRLGGCSGCNADSFRAMKGCSHCARLTIRRYKGSDRDLIDLYEMAKKDLVEYRRRFD